MPNTDLLLGTTYDEDRIRGVDRRNEIDRAREDARIRSSAGTLAAFAALARQLVRTVYAHRRGRAAAAPRATSQG